MICMFRLALDKTSHFYINHAIEVSDARKNWGYETKLCLRALAKKIHDNLSHRRFDEITDSITSFALEETPRHETGFEIGVGRACWYGTQCKRCNCWFAHPRIDLSPEERATK